MHYRAVTITFSIIPSLIHTDKFNMTDTCKMVQDCRSCTIYYQTIAYFKQLVLCCPHLFVSAIENPTGWLKRTHKLIPVELNAMYPFLGIRSETTPLVIDCSCFVSVSGVGKTSLVHLICQNEPTSNPSWTIGCSVDVKVVWIKYPSIPSKVTLIDITLGLFYGHT